MGLSGRKTKQRIGNDPRNLAWANDANKFGAAYLAKLGWDPSRGLGVSGEGRTKALSVTQKLDMLGIGADHKNSAEGLAWKQNKDFESLLRRLNAGNGSGDGEATDEPMKIDGFVRPSAPRDGDGEDTGAPGAGDEDMKSDVVGEDDGVKRSKKKRKKDAEDGDGERTKKRKKSKSSEEQESDAERKSKKDKKKKKAGDVDDVLVSVSAPDTSAPSPTSVVASTSTAPTPVKHPRAAFRGRHMAAKKLASKSESAIAEILGVSASPTPGTSSQPSSVPTPYPSTPFEPGPSTSASSADSGVATPAEELKLQELSVSSKSVMDYFKEKLSAKSNARVFAPPSSCPTTFATDRDDEDERPRMGLGASRLRVEATTVAEERCELGGIGSGGLRSQFAAMFAPAVAASPNPETEVEAEIKGEQEEAGEEVGDESKEKRSKKAKKEKKSKKDKGKIRVVIAAVEQESMVACEAPSGGAQGEDAETERRRRKEEKRRRRKEAEAIAAAGAAADEVEAGAGAKEQKQKKKDRKSKKEKS